MLIVQRCMRQVTRNGASVSVPSLPSLLSRNRTSRKYVEAAITQHLTAILDSSASGERPRFLLGITGPPATGKSTFASLLATVMNDRMGDAFAVTISMDGFHLSDEVLKARGSYALKGAPHTFDAQGFVDLLHQLRADTPETVWCPVFKREPYDRVEGAVAVEHSTRMVIVEGNYLLLTTPPWQHVRTILDQVWYLDTPRDVIKARLVKRHMGIGRTEEQAISKVEESDLPNADIIEASRSLADQIL